jgi:serine/threonine protein kinase
MSALGLTTV